MPIDPKRIEEWKGLAEELEKRPTSLPNLPSISQVAEHELAAHAAPLLLTERGELIALLREIEWGPWDRGDEYDGCCPKCRGRRPGSNMATDGRTGEKEIDHAPDCHLVAFLR